MDSSVQGSVMLTSFKLQSQALVNTLVKLLGCNMYDIFVLHMPSGNLLTSSATLSSYRSTVLRRDLYKMYGVIIVTVLLVA
jgi:hypothetical protein